MKVLLSWWPPQHSPGGRAQAIAGNVKGFQDAGHEVEVWWNADVRAAAQKDFLEYDLLVVPYIDTGFSVPIPVHLQIGGHGPPSVDVEGLKAAISNATSVSVLDPRLALYFEERTDVDLESARLIPNAPNVHLFDPQPPERTEGHVVVPKVGGPYKSADILTNVANATGDIAYRTFVSADPPTLPSNVATTPAVPLSDMPRSYGTAELVFNPSVREGQPNVAIEAMLSQRPFVATPRGIGLAQTIPRDVLDPDDFGTEVGWFVDEYQTAFNEGDHYQTAATSHLPTVLNELMADRQRRHDLGRRGREWAASLDYSWADKADAIIRAMAEA